MAETLDGKTFVARVRLSDREDRTLAVPGETCERVAPASLPWLLEQGCIEPVSPAAVIAAPAPVAPAIEEE